MRTNEKRLKGKAIMNSTVHTPMSKAKDSSSLALLIGRNTIIIREPPDLVSPNHQSLAIHKEDDSRIKPRQEERLERSENIFPSHGIHEVGEDGFFNEEQAKMITITAEDEDEVDKLVSEFYAVIDKNMMENDDLLVDEPGLEAEQIDAISQLSPMITQEDNTGDGRDNEQQQADGEALQGSYELDRNIAVSQHNRVDHSSGSQQPARGLLRRKPTLNPDVKGTCASRKLQAYKGRSPKKNKGSGLVVFQKPPSKKI